MRPQPHCTQALWLVLHLVCICGSQIIYPESIPRSLLISGVPSPRELYKKRYDLFILARISSVDAHLYTLVSTGSHILYNY